MELTAQVHQNNNDLLFKSFYKEVWRKMIPKGLTEAETDFIVEIAHLETGAAVLDIMCGYGRHSIALAKRGFKLNAVDNLTDYINEIKDIAEEQKLSINSWVADVSATSFNGLFDAIICMGNCFSTFDKPRAKTLLYNLHKCLKPGGSFIINSWMIAEIAIKHFEEKTWLYVDEFKYLLDNKYLLNPTRIETDHILIREDEALQTLKAIDYVLSFSELENLLEEAGFEMGEVYATPRKKRFQLGDKNAYIVATKKF